MMVAARDDYAYVEFTVKMCHMYSYMIACKMQEHNIMLIKISVSACIHR